MIYKEVFSTIGTFMQNVCVIHLRISREHDVPISNFLKKNEPRKASKHFLLITCVNCLRNIDNIDAQCIRFVYYKIRILKMQCVL